MARAKRQETNKGSVATFVAFILFSLTIGVLYINSRHEWVYRASYAEYVADSLRVELADSRSLRNKEIQRIDNVRHNEFDPYDSQDYRVYGLYRDEERKYTASQVATFFNVFPPNAVKSSDVIGERWHIVPIKTVHFYDGNETLTEIAKLYYKNIKDSVLISRFNHTIDPERHLFIPFD